MRALKQGSIKGLALRRSDSANSGLLCTEDSANKTTEGTLHYEHTHTYTHSAFPTFYITAL